MQKLSAKLLETARRVAHHAIRRRTRFAMTGFIAGCLWLMPPDVAASGSWTQGADLPGPTSTPGACVVDGILYVLGGHYPDSANALQQVYAYDPRTNAWTRKTDMPTARHFLAAAAVDGILYVMGGSGAGVPGTGVLPVEAYDPKTDTWTTKANIPTGRGTFAACVLDGIIYAIGGALSGSEPLATVEAYDPKTDQWTTKSSLPKPLMFPTASAVDGLIYVFQGTETFAYDPQTDRWTAKAQFSPWSMGLVSGMVDGIIYLFGGMNSDMRESFDFTLAYDPARDQFSPRQNMPRTRLTGGCGVIDGKVYLAGGVSKEPIVNPDAIFYTFLDVFDPQALLTPEIEPSVQLVPPGSNATFRATAYGPASMTYQWQFNGTNIADATNTTLTLTNVQIPNEGEYTVVVTHTTGSVTSAPVNLWIVITPVILQPPLSQTVVQGGTVTLSAVISGYPPPFLFQWRRGFTVLTNIVQPERTCFFTLANVQMNQGGLHRLYITNAASPNWTTVNTNFTLTVLADTDTDGLPDVWETECGLNPASANHGTADDDGDGFTNRQEYTAGTDPTNALNYLEMDTITLAEDATAAALSFQATSNKTYTVQYRNSLDEGDWNRLADVVAVPSNRVVEISDPGAGPAARRFYRLVTPRAP